MTTKDFSVGEMVVIRQGYGFWDVSSLPYGGSFHRASSAFGARVIGPGGKYPERELIVDAAGCKLCVSVESVIRLSKPFDGKGVTT